MKVLPFISNMSIIKCKIVIDSELCKIMEHYYSIKYFHEMIIEDLIILNSFFALRLQLISPFLLFGRGHVKDDTKIIWYIVYKSY